jgi:hypothetical protein
MRGRLSMQRSRLSQSSLLCSLLALAGRCSDNLIATELLPQYPHFRHRMGDCAMQPWRHNSVVLTEYGIRVSHKEV